MIPYEWIEQARDRISGYIEQTPLTFDEKRGLYLKWENRQVTGSFKPRGALNKVLTLQEWERTAGLVAASAGNHGQGEAAKRHADLHRRERTGAVPLKPLDQRDVDRKETAQAAAKRGPGDLTVGRPALAGWLRRLSDLPAMRETALSKD